MVSSAAAGKESRLAMKIEKATTPNRFTVLIRVSFDQSILTPDEQLLVLLLLPH
jgi:hypothetical protein